MTFSYPRDAVVSIRGAWKETAQHELPPLPSDEVLTRFLEVAYHASMRREEQRPIRFRLALLETGYKSPATYADETVRPIVTSNFGEPLPFEVDDVVRLAPAADPAKTSIVVWPDAAGTLRIWGLLDVGTSWWSYGRGEAVGGYAPPPALSIVAQGPGVLRIEQGARRLVTLRNGKLGTGLGALAVRPGPIRDFLAPAASKFRDKLGEHIPEAVLDGYAAFYFAYYDRVLQGIADRGHGATVIVVPHAADPLDTFKDLLDVKYRCARDTAWTAAARHLVLERQRQKALQGLDPAAFRSDSEYLLRAWGNARDALAESAAFAIDLAAVDGALLMTDRLRILGFGVEILAKREVETIRVAETASGRTGRRVSCKAYGTRHRSAFRLCASADQVLVFVMSQDGGVKAVCQFEGDVVMWPDVETLREIPANV